VEDGWYEVGGVGDKNICRGLDRKMIDFVPGGESLRYASQAEAISESSLFIPS
jgi:hypothetical protein